MNIEDCHHVTDVTHQFDTCPSQLVS